MIASAQNHAYLLLTVTLLIVSFSLVEPVMAWILILVVCACVMRVALYLQLHKHAPSVRTLNLLALLSGIVLAYYSVQLGILLGMVNLLVMACALKLMLLRSQKDFYQLVTSCGFLIGCGFIFQQGILFSALYLCLIGLLLISMAFNISPNRPVANLLKHTGTMGLQAIPITLLLFLVLPQIGPLWQMPSGKRSETGLSEKVTPGDIAKLSQSSELAFRATFKDSIPTAQQRYWRALVLEQFDGASWQVSEQRKATRRQYWQFAKEFAPDVSGPYFTYDVIAQPTHQTWVYAIDVAIPQGVSSNQKIWQSQDYQLISTSPLVSSFQYSVRSYPQSQLNQSLYSLDSRINLQLPSLGNPKTQEWVKQLRQTFPKDEDLIAAVMDYFTENQFVYTLQPELMPNDPVDTFLFEQRAGFCSHYASAMAYALRLAGIPARMVAGYQGGELHPDNYLSVYQYDAHAWVEAWSDDTGWRRYDPTSTVAPNRIEYGLRAAVGDENFLLDSPFSLARFSTVPWLNKLRLALANMDYQWTKWVLGFDRNKQQDLIKALIGKLTPQRLALFGLGVFTVICLLLVLFYLPIWRNPKRDKLAQVYHQAEKQFAQIGLSRNERLGPVEFAQQVKHSTHQALHQPFDRLTRLFVASKYAPANNHHEKHTLAKMKQELQEIKKALKHHQHAQPS